MAIGYFIVGRLPHLASAWVGGISCGILVRSPEWWPYLVAPCIAILSKYVIRLHGRHLWNPSNFAVAALLLIAPQTVASLSIQWGNHVLPMMVIWLFGGVIVYRLNRFHISGTYVLFFFLLAVLAACLMFVLFVDLKIMSNGGLIACSLIGDVPVPSEMTPLSPSHLNQ